jgi:uncharacterized protein (TIGR02599 family)
MRSSTRLRAKCRSKASPGFTLLETLITVTILAAILVSLAQLVAGVSHNSDAAAEDPYEEAQEAFETMSANLATATLASYQDYADSTGAFRTAGSASFVPDHLARRSDLDFVCGPASGANGLLAASHLTTAGSSVFFLAPNGYTQTWAHQGLGHLLNAMGYYVEFGTDDAAPSFIPLPSRRWRWRLKQIEQPAESLQVFANPTSAQWLGALVPSGSEAPVLAENVITLVVLPERDATDTGADLAPAYSYDSRDTTNRLTLHQLPPRLRLAIVAIDPVIAERFAAQDGSTPPQLVPANLFQQDTQLDADLATLDSSLTAQKINPRIFQREISLTSSAWSDTPSP